ncbi:MAG: hypothetical protein HY898_11780 [Deltaproteobacteria bacterium]|nr:hypothetical protein [Deltaproteobacteria bacterium]
MHEDERPTPWLVAILVFVLPACFSVGFAFVHHAGEPAGSQPVESLILRAVLASLLVVVPGVLHAARRQAPGVTMLLMTLIPVTVAVGMPFARHKGLVSSYWAGEAIALEASSALRRAWASAADGAFLSAQLSASYCLAAGLWPASPSRTSNLILGVGQERVPLLLAGPAASILAAAAWKLAGLSVLPSDVLIWIVVALPAITFGLGPSKPRTRREAMRFLSAAVAASLLLTVAGQAERLSDVTAKILQDASQGRWYAAADDLPREILLRWCVAGIATAFGMAALLPGRIRVRKHRRRSIAAKVPLVAALAVPAMGAVLPGWCVDRDVRRARLSWRSLLDARGIQLPSCTTTPVAVSAGTLVVVPARGEALVERAGSGVYNVAASRDTPVRVVFRALAGLALPPDAPVEFLVSGCGRASSARSNSPLSEVVAGDLRGVRIKVSSALDCAGAPDTAVVAIEGTHARVLRNACSAVPPAPEQMDVQTAWKHAVGRQVAVGASEGVNVATFLEALRGAPAASAVVVTDHEAIRSWLDRAATRDMLIDPGSRGPWSGALLLLSVSASALQPAHPEALYGPLRAASDLYRCFESVTSDLHLRIRVDLGASGGVRSAAVEGEGSAGPATCISDQVHKLVFSDSERDGTFEARLAWYPSALPAPEGLIASGALSVRGEADHPALRGADGLAARLASPFARCVGEALQAEPEASGVAEVKVCVQGNGVLQPASADSTRLSRGTLECMRDSVKALRADPEHLTGGDARCFRAMVTLRNPNEDNVYHLEITVQEGEREAARKRPTGESENTYRARLLAPDILGCFGHPADAQNLEGQMVLTATVNKTGNVMAVLSDARGVSDARLTRCAVDAVKRMKVAVDAESPMARMGVTLKIATTQLR